MRRVLLVAVAAAFALVATAPLAAAQLPDSGTCGPIALNVAPSEASVEAGASETFTGQVENRGNIAGTVHLAVDEASVPDGWSAILGTEDVEVEGGASGTFTLAVRPPTDATDAADITVVAVLQCGGVQALTSRSQSSTITILPTPAENGLGALGQAARSYGPVVLGVIVLGGFAAAAVVGSGRLRTVGFEVNCPESFKRVRPGRGTSFPVEVHNRGRGPDTAQFLVGEVPEGWTAFTALPEFALGPGERRTLWLMVRAPEGAPEGERARMEVTVRSDAHPERTITRAVHAEVTYEMPVVDDDDEDAVSGVGP